jgi:hypothetical protein
MTQLLRSMSFPIHHALLLSFNKIHLSLIKYYTRHQETTTQKQSSLSLLKGLYISIQVSFHRTPASFYLCHTSLSCGTKVISIHSGYHNYFYHQTKRKDMSKPVCGEDKEGTTALWTIHTLLRVVKRV